MAHWYPCFITATFWKPICSSIWNAKFALHFIIFILTRCCFASLPPSHSHFRGACISPSSQNMMKYGLLWQHPCGRLLFCPMWGDLRVLNSRFHVLDSGFLGSGFWSPDSMGWIPKPWIPQAKISRIPDSELAHRANCLYCIFNHAYSVVIFYLSQLSYFKMLIHFTNPLTFHF